MFILFHTENGLLFCGEKGSDFFRDKGMSGIIRMRHIGKISGKYFLRHCFELSCQVENGYVFLFWQSADYILSLIHI